MKRTNYNLDSMNVNQLQHVASDNDYNGSVCLLVRNVAEKRILAFINDAEPLTGGTLGEWSCLYNDMDEVARGYHKPIVRLA